MILLLTLMSITGAAYVARGMTLPANYIWSVANAGLIWHNLSIAEFEMAFLFGVYEALAIYGIYNLRFQVKPDEK